MIWYPDSGPASNQCSTSRKINSRLYLNTFRREPASSWFDWHFTPPLIFQHQSVRTSTQCHLRFILVMVRSPGFGSNACNKFALFRLAFAEASGINPLTKLHTLTRRIILQQARYPTIDSGLTDCKLTVLGSISLSFSLFFSPFHRCTCSLSVTRKYLALRDGSRRFRQDSTCPALLGILSGVCYF